MVFDREKVIQWAVVQVVVEAELSFVQRLGSSEHCAGSRLTTLVGTYPPPRSASVEVLCEHTEHSLLRASNYFLRLQILC